MAYAAEFIYLYLGCKAHIIKCGDNIASSFVISIIDQLPGSPLINLIY